MHEFGLEKVITIAAVLLFFALGVAILVIMDHKARIPGGFKRDPFSISGMRRDHPVESFLTMTILMGIILALVLSLLATIGGAFGLFQKEEESELLLQLGEERMVERMRHFHNVPEVHYEDLGKKNVCFYCHGDYPHSKKPMIRTLMNMHTQFVGCMTCHNDPKKVDQNALRFEWLNFSGIEVKGPPFGTARDPKSGHLIATDDYYSKIVVYAMFDGNEQLLEMTESVPEVAEFLKIRETLTDKDKEALKKRFHKYIRPKGRACDRCHTEEARSYLPFRALGFSDDRIQDVTHSNIIGLVKKYRKFNFPDLLDAGRIAGAPEPEPEEPKTPDRIKKNPRAWWKENYDDPSPTGR